MEASNLWDTLVGLIAGLQSPHDPSTVLRPLLKAISDGSQKLNNLTRQYLLQSDPFHDPGVLEKITKGKSKHMVDLGLVSDAMLRSQNIEKRVGAAVSPRSTVLLANLPTLLTPVSPILSTTDILAKRSFRERKMAK